MKKIVSGIMLTLLLIGMLTLVSNAQAAEPVYFSETGHYYQAIAIAGVYEGIYTVSGGITWNDAKSLAESLSYLGVQGHLATITSKAENDFIINNLGGPDLLNRYWLGGFQPPGSPEPDGNWQWVTGEPWIYANWASGEPNNCYGGEMGGAPAGSDEERLHFWGYTGQWNDMEESSYQPGLIVEYDIPPVPVGGYSFSMEGYTATKPLTPYLALVAILTVVFTAIKSKTQRRTKHS